MSAILTPREVTRHSFPGRWALRLDGALLALTGLLALGADLAGALSGLGPFASLSGQPLAIAAVEAHGLAALLGLLIFRGAAMGGERWLWHAVAFGAHVFLAACNLLFWQSYGEQGLVIAGVATTVAHTTLACLQLVCLAHASPAHEQDALPGWLVAARHSGLYVRSVAVITLALGASVHVATLVQGREAMPQILPPPAELALTLLIAYVSVAGWLAWPSFVFHGRWQQVLLALVLVYFPVGLPLHVRTLVTGSVAHYEAIPFGYSALIVPVMAAMALLFVSLRRRPQGS